MAAGRFCLIICDRKPVFFRKLAYPHPHHCHGSQRPDLTLCLNKLYRSAHARCHSLSLTSQADENQFGEDTFLNLILLSPWRVFQQLGLGIVLDFRTVEVSPPAGSTPAEVIAEVTNLNVNTSPSIRDVHVSMPTLSAHRWLMEVPGQEVRPHNRGPLAPHTHPVSHAHLHNKHS